MNTSSTPLDAKPFDMAQMARDARRGDLPEQEPPSSLVPAVIIPAGTPQLPIKAGQNLLQSSDEAWLEGTRTIQRNLIRQLQESKSSWWERRLIGQVRQQVIREVAEKYVMYLREEAKMTSEAALQARRVYLERELLELKLGIKQELADMIGKSIAEIDAIFQSRVAQIQTEALRNAYALYVMTQIYDLLGQEPPKK